MNTSFWYSEDEPVLQPLVVSEEVMRWAAENEEEELDEDEQERCLILE